MAALKNAGVTKVTLGAYTGNARKHHELKTDVGPFEQTWLGDKPWELRFNDRDFQEGDTATLKELIGHQCDECSAVYLGTLCPDCASFEHTSKYSGREIDGEIKFVLLEGYGLPTGCCIFTFMPTERRVFQQDGVKIIL
jgi:hypothetical protein